MVYEMMPTVVADVQLHHQNPGTHSSKIRRLICCGKCDIDLSSLLQSLQRCLKIPKVSSTGLLLSFNIGLLKSNATFTFQLTNIIFHQLWYHGLTYNNSSVALIWVIGTPTSSFFYHMACHQGLCVLHRKDETISC